MTSIIELKCKNCGAPMNREGQELICPYCLTRILITTPPPPVQEKLSGDEWMQRANQLYRERKFQQAIEACKQALIAGSRSNSQAYIQTVIGNSLDELSRYEEAIEAHKISLALDPKFYRAWVNLGVAYRHAGNLNEAERCYRQAEKINPNYAELYTSLGALYIFREEPQKAIDALQKAIRLDPQVAISYGNLALAYSMVGRFTEAENSLAQAVTRGYKNAQTVKERIEQAKALRGKK